MIPPEPDPPEPPTPTPTYNDWEYLSTSTFRGNTVYVDVGSASDSFVGVVSVGLTGNANWYSDGSLIKLADKYYPFDRAHTKYYNYTDKALMYWDSVDGVWMTEVVNPTVFDQVPADFISYLENGNFTLVQG